MAGTFQTAVTRIVARFYRRYPGASPYRWDETGVKSRIYGSRDAGQRCTAVRKLGQTADRTVAESYQPLANI